MKFSKVKTCILLIIISTAVLFFSGCNLLLDPIPDGVIFEFQFMVESPQHVVLGINDGGKEIRRLLDDQFSPGMYSFVWEGRDADGKRIYSNKNYTARLRGENNSSIVMFKVDKRGSINVNNEIVDMILFDPLE